MMIAQTHTGHVNQNQFVLLDVRNSQFLSDKTLGTISQRLCAESTCDDLIVIDHSHKANARMRVFGADAREADFCGNGSLLALDVLFSERGRALKVGAQATLETRAGLKTGFYRNGAAHYIQFGKVTNADSSIQDLNIDRNALEMIAAWGAKVVGFRIAGEPHLIMKRDIVSDNRLRDQAQFELLAENVFNSVAYAGGVNITIIMKHDQGSADVITFERGVRRLTQSCGSGSVAAASYLSDQTRSGGLLTMRSRGGRHRVEVLEAGGTILLSGDVVRHIRTKCVANSILKKFFPQVAVDVSRNRSNQLHPGGRVA